MERTAGRWLTFSEEIRATTAAINRLCSRPPEKSRLFFDGHVSGIKNLVYDKATDMALLYNATRLGDRATRLLALSRLRDEAFNYQGLEMPYNTRRVLIALMKETVKARGDLLQQYRYMAAFRHALSGRAYVVRMSLGELGLAEVPEAPGSGAVRARGWDDHVYDNAGPGRKTPAQLILDAYIKGLANLTIVYEDFQELEPLSEAIEAGNLMGIEVTIGLECLVLGKWNRHLHHVLLLRDCPGERELGELLDSGSFKRLLKLLQANYSEHDRIYAELASAFNENSLPLINDGFWGTAGELPPLSIESLKEQAKGRHLYHVHLGQLLARRLDRLSAIRRELRPGAEDLAALPVGELRRRFFDPIASGILDQAEFVKASKLYTAVEEVERELGVRRVEIAYTRPLDNDLQSCVEHLIANAAAIDALEVWNNRVRQEGYAEKARFLESLRRALNHGDPAEVELLLASQSIAGPLAGPNAGLSEAKIATAAERYGQRHLEARVGSDSDGYNHLAPGMGFAPRDNVRNWRAIERSNRSAALPLTLPIARPGGRKAVEAVILPLGRDRGAAASRKATRDRPPSLLMRWRDLNRTIRTSMRILGGAALSLSAGWILSLVSGLPYSFGLLTLAAFFAITFARNYIVDEVARHGLHPSRWRLSSFDKTNAANSVFFTFISVPLLSFVEQLLVRFAFGELASSGGPEGIALRLARYVPLALINGVYIYGHNSLRGFTRPVKRANFWRSALAFPVAIGLSYLNPWAMIPGVLINKIASDIIGGFTEVGFKIGRETKRARALYADLLPSLGGTPTAKREKYLQRLAVLDVLYIWGESPRGKEGLKRAIERNPESEAIWNCLATPVRSYETYVKLITSKTGWRKPQRIKLEFLRLAAAFSYWLEKNGPSSAERG